MLRHQINREKRRRPGGELKSSGFVDACEHPFGRRLPSRLQVPSHIPKCDDSRGHEPEAFIQAKEGLFEPDGSIRSRKQAIRTTVGRSLRRLGEETRDLDN